MTLQRSKPIVDQIKPILKDRIRNKVYPPGGRLPSESDLADELRVSRATIRSVLAQLAAEGFILRRQGDGTYVNERIHDIESRYGGWNFLHLIELNGYSSSIKPISIEQRKVSDVEADWLGVATDTSVTSIERLFAADDIPVIVTINVIPDSILDGAVDLADEYLPIDELLKKYCDEDITYAITDIDAVSAEKSVIKELKRTIDYPILKLTETFYNKANQPVAFGLSYYDHRMLRLRLVQPWG